MCAICKKNKHTWNKLLQCYKSINAEHYNAISKLNYEYNIDYDIQQCITDYGFKHLVRQTAIRFHNKDKV